MILSPATLTAQEFSFKQIAATEGSTDSLRIFPAMNKGGTVAYVYSPEFGHVQVLSTKGDQTTAIADLTGPAFSHHVWPALGSWGFLPRWREPARVEIGRDRSSAALRVHEGQVAVRSHEIDGIAPQAGLDPSPDAMERRAAAIFASAWAHRVTQLNDSQSCGGGRRSPVHPLDSDSV
jgi:hypothetical protein